MHTFRHCAAVLTAATPVPGLTLLRCREGFSLLLYGFGSKRALLERFMKEALVDGGVLAITGHVSGLSVRAVLQQVASAMRLPRRAVRPPVSHAKASAWRCAQRCMGPHCPASGHGSLPDFVRAGSEQLGWPPRTGCTLKMHTAAPLGPSMPLLLRRSGSSQAILQSIREQPAEPPMYVVIHNIEGSGEMTNDKPLAASCPAFATPLVTMQVTLHAPRLAHARHPGADQRPVHCLRLLVFPLQGCSARMLCKERVEGAGRAGLGAPEVLTWPPTPASAWLKP